MPRFKAVDHELLSSESSIVFVCSKGRHRAPAVCTLWLLRACLASGPEEAMEMLVSAARSKRPEQALPQFKWEGPHYAPGLRPWIMEFAQLLRPHAADS